MSASTGLDDQDIRKRMTAEWAAARIIAEWEAGAKALALLEGVARAGLLDALRVEATEPGLAASGYRARRLCAALCPACWADSGG